MENNIETLRASLTPYMLAFCENYALSLNATDAIQKAGYEGDNPRQVAYSMMQNEKVQSYLEELRRAQREALGISRDRVLQELARIAYFDIRQLYDEMGVLKPISELSDDIAAAISTVETKELYEQDGPNKKYIGDGKKVKSHDKIKALEMLAKHLGIFSLDNSQKRNNVIIVNNAESKEIFKSLDEEY